jgi:L-rhamnose isomerase
VWKSALGGYLGRVRIALDYFDATINRVAAWVIGTRNLLRALLIALLEPSKLLRDAEASGDYTSRLALQEEFKLLPAGAVWDYHRLDSGVPVGYSWISEVKSYEIRVLAKR